MATALLILIAGGVFIRTTSEAASVSGKSTPATTTAYTVSSVSSSISLAGNSQRNTVDISAAAVLSSGSSGRRSNAAGTAVVVNPDDDDLTGSAGSESTRKWRAARRQMLRRVFMLLSSNAASESAADSDRNGRDSLTRSGGGHRSRADKSDTQSAAASDDGRKDKDRRYRHGKLSTAAVAQAVRPRQPTATIGNVRLLVSEADDTSKGRPWTDGKVGGGSHPSSTSTNFKNNVINQIDSDIGRRILMLLSAINKRSTY